MTPINTPIIAISPGKTGTETRGEAGHSEPREEVMQLLRGQDVASSYASGKALLIDARINRETRKESIAVLIPAYNEEKNIRETLESILFQTLPPRIILLGDNDSTDNTARVAKETLSGSKIDYVILRISRDPRLSKLNINNVYYALYKVLEKLKLKIDYLATIEADVVLEPRYFEKLVRVHKLDPKTCITGGVLHPLGLPQDPFPLSIPIHLWGSNRLYRYTCWQHLNNLVDIRLLPAWDTDHVILALLQGYHVVPVRQAHSYTKRHVRPFRGRAKGWMDGIHKLPIWWAIYKTLQYGIDLDYFAGYLAVYLSSRARANPYLDKVAQVYKWGALNILKNYIT